ncbi:related to ATP synthase chain j, mitochondrial [Cephalotrichum gorgonifer]|uniref:Related to ATP synthase chain j, mitochondrial n=1 Tax=Cephalotrichum gorgonifer TaxID=2041049 RepID=A0AAE8MVW8_9PEZI|nr:related to ATP synthase chain j, mitochondrial [Cephalotrichum gorgonifer]
MPLNGTASKNSSSNPIRSTNESVLSQSSRTPPTTTAKMLWFGARAIKKFPSPTLKPLAPFWAAGLIVLYGVNSAQDAMMAGAEWKNDPRNPHAK